jgi:ABC-type branched-subunit amino acid transport system substrate-binding protein
MMPAKTLRLAPFVLAAALLSCGEESGRARAPLCIGAVLPLTGADAEAGAEVLMGLELAAAESADSAALTVRSLDGESDPVVSVRRCAEFGGDPGIVLAVGGWSAAAGRLLAADRSRGDLPLLLLSPLAWPSFGSPPRGVLVAHRLAGLGAAAALFAREDLGAETAGILGRSDRDASAALTRAFADQFVAAGGDTLWTLAPPDSGALTVPSGVRSVPAVVFVAGPAEWARRFLAGRRRQTPLVLLFAAGWDLAAAGQLSEEGHQVFVVSFFSESDPRGPVREFVDACVRAGITPRETVAAGWDAYRLLAAARRAGGESRAGFAARLALLPAQEGVNGTLSVAVGPAARESPAVSSVTPTGTLFLRRLTVGNPSVPGTETVP